MSGDRGAEFLAHLEAGGRRFYVAFDRALRLAVLRHKDAAGLTEWRARRWTLFEGRAPDIVPVDVSPLLLALDAETRAPVGARALWWSPASGFALRGDTDAPADRDVLVRDGDDRPEWAERAMIRTCRDPLVAFDATDRRLPSHGAAATVVQVETAVWVRDLWALARWPRARWAQIVWRRPDQLVVIDALEVLGPTDLPLRDCHAWPRWATDGLHLVAGVEPARSVGLRRAARERRSAA